MNRTFAFSAVALALALAAGAPVPSANAADNTSTSTTTTHHRTVHRRHATTTRQAPAPLEGSSARPGAGGMTGSQAGQDPAAAKNYPPTNTPSAPTGH